MFRYEAGEWHWADRKLGLIEPEPTLLTAMLKSRDVRRQPHVWLAYEVHQPYSPAAALTFLMALQRKLEWAGAPAHLLDLDVVHGATMSGQAVVADDAATSAALSRPPGAVAPQETAGAVRLESPPHPDAKRDAVDQPAGRRSPGTA